MPEDIYCEEGDHYYSPDDVSRCTSCMESCLDCCDYRCERGLIEERGDEGIDTI
jgi:hypothetical protein